MSLSAKIYDTSPPFLQNILISAEGLRLKRVRYSREFFDLLSKDKGIAGKSSDEIEFIQLSRLKAFLDYAYKNSLFYKKSFDSWGVYPTSISCLNDLRKFPELSKNDLRRSTDEIRSKASLFRKDMQFVSTSGTTGTPIRVAFTPEDTRQRFSFLYRMLSRFGIEPFDRSVRFSGRTLVTKGEGPPWWRMNYAQRQMFMSTYHMQPQNLDHYVSRLADYAPALIDGYPSAIFILARHINRRGWQGRIRPRLVMTTAETLEDFQRAEIAEAFGGVAVANQYASSEGAPWITEDEFGDLVVNTDSGVIEVADGSNEGEMLVTSFTTHAFPLIRYRIGDRIALEPGRLARSMAMPVAKAITGRQEDLIISPDRGPVGRLDPVFKKMPSTIVESQIVQAAPDRVVLRVVPDRASGYERAQIDGVVAEMRARLGAMAIDVEEHDSLPRSANGKLRAVVGLSMRDY